MTVEISPAWVSAGCAILGVVGGWLVTWIIGPLRAGQKILFEKLDSQTSALQDYKLHVAETYVAEAKLEKMFLSLNSRLDSIERWMRKGDQ